MLTIEWLRQFRIGPFSMFDLFGALLGVFILSPVLTRLAKKIGLEIGVVQWLWLTFPISVIAHGLLGLHTPFMQRLLDPTGHWLVKLWLIFSTFMGVFQIKRGSKNEKNPTGK